MTNYIRRFIYVDDAERQKVNPLIYPFLFATLIYGLGFALLGDWTGVSTSSLFTAMWSLHNFLPALWGIAAALAALLGVAVTAFRQVHLGEAASMFGFLVWFFAGLIYLLSGYWLVLMTVALPNTYFWLWFYLRLKWYARMKSTGSLVDPQ